MNRVLLTIALLMFAAQGAATEPSSNKSQWLGAYRAAEIPGYKITESLFAVQSRATKYTSSEQDFAGDVTMIFVEGCKKQGGIAVVNLHVDVHFTKIVQNQALVDPGIYVVVQGDCVYKVKKAD